jgi:hypothetical protein
MRKTTMKRITNHKSNLTHVNKMKTRLIERGQTLFTRKEFIETAKTSRYYFDQLIQSGLIVNTGNVFSNRQGAPLVYELASVFLSHTEPKEGYRLTQEDVKILLKEKDAILLNLGGSIVKMQSQVNVIKKQRALLSKIELV